MPGHSAIYTFPFRCYGVPGIRDVEIEGADVRIRIHAPATLRKKGMPLSPDYPPTDWPLFRWSPWVGRRSRLLPPSQFGVKQGLGGAHYDGLRVDLWGEDAESRLTAFVERFLAWLRHLSGQAWIGRYEPHTDVAIKYGFSIDENGRATDAPWAYAGFITAPPWSRPVTAELMEVAGRHALDSVAPLYWTSFHDAEIARALGDDRTTILLLAISLETARDTCFKSFADTIDKRVVGEVLCEPFDGTNLLRHLSVALQEAHPNSPNLERDLPEVWAWIKALYSARHHVAHGGPVAGVVGDAFRHLTREDLWEVTLATHRTVQWIEGLVVKG